MLESDRKHREEAHEILRKVGPGEIHNAIYGQGATGVESKKDSPRNLSEVNLDPERQAMVDDSIESSDYVSREDVGTREFMKKAFGTDSPKEDILDFKTDKLGDVITRPSENETNELSGLDESEINSKS
ncbi:MAG: hypothetical protein IT410_02030 [Candidatus Doudnabacteria bacterium]|nr:hypothetical protein [Candidatus Doudnabacteria bacterium]